jgi:putative phage-type endonuclease
MIEVIRNENRESWLAARKQDVTASEVGALFGINPYMSEYELFNLKSGKIEAEFKDNERMEWGNLLEPVIAKAIASKQGLEIVEQGGLSYYRNTATRMGATPDFFIKSPDKEGVGLLQIKNVDSLVFKNKWTSPQDGGEAPAYIETQIQHEMTVTGLKWGKIGVLVGGNSLQVYDRISYDEVSRTLTDRVQKFWKDVEANNPPKPDWDRDLDFIMRLYSPESGKSCELNDEMEHLAEMYVQYQQAEKNASESKDAVKAQIISLLGDHEKGISQRFKVSATKVAENPGKIVTPDMVGKYVGGRKAFTTFRVTKTSNSEE